METISSNSQVTKSAITKDGFQLSWRGFLSECKELSLLIANTRKTSGCQGLYGIPTGGCFVAMELSKELCLPLLDSPMTDCLVIDDLIDSGETMKGYQRYQRAALFNKPHSPPGIALTCREVEGWVVFPWEQDHPRSRPGRGTNGPTQEVVRLLEWVGENPNRDGLKDTPDRVCRALKEMTRGYGQDPKEVLGRVFDQEYDEIVAVKGIPFTSLCEHHLMPYVGTVDIGYLPAPGKVVGLSKLARLVDCFAMRLQVQERLTKEIAEAIMEHLSAKGVGVIVRAEHTCLSCRGIKKPGAKMVTSSMLGLFRDKPEARAEFLELVK